MGCECPRAGLHHLCVVDVGRRLIGRVPINRCRSDLDQRPAYDSRIFGSACHAVKAAEEKYGSANPHNDCKSADQCKKTHMSLRGIIFKGVKRYTGPKVAKFTLS